jgi:hypothetical protein
MVRFLRATLSTRISRKNSMSHDGLQLVLELYYDGKLSMLKIVDNIGDIYGRTNIDSDHLQDDEIRVARVSLKPCRVNLAHW